MQLNSLNLRPAAAASGGRASSQEQLQHLLAALEGHTLPDTVVTAINKEIDSLNALPESDTRVARAAKQAQQRILSSVEKELKLVPKKRYARQWMVLGMSLFGIPFGLALGTAIKNYGMLGAGLPMGMGIGAAMGMAMDQKALREGRQLDFEAR